MGIISYLRNYFRRLKSSDNSIILPFCVSFILFGRLLTVSSRIFYPILYALLFLLVIITPRSSQKKYNIFAILFLIAGLISIIANSETINMLFRPWERLALFAIMFAGLGPMGYSAKSTRFRYVSAEIMQIFFLIITLLSLVVFALNLPFGYNRTGFCGITGHSMDLSPIAALSSLFCLKESFEKPKKQMIIWILLMLASMAVMIIAASRGAMGGFLVALIMLVYSRVRKISFLIKSLILVGGLALLLYTVNPGGIMTGLEYKMERTESTGDISGGRSGKVVGYIDSFNDSPIFGIGFSTMKYGNVTAEGYFEPSNGWLFILSSTGIFGFLCVFILICQALNRSFRINRCSFYCATLVFFIVHSIIEGYILTIGNVFCIYMWMIVALLMDSKELANYE